jgi:hypothetical protein
MEGDSALETSKRLGMTERPKPDLTAELHRTLNNGQSQPMQS